MIKMDHQRQHRYPQLVLVPCPFQGHINPVLNLASILHSKGFPITIIQTHLSILNQSNYPEFNFLHLSSDCLSNQNVTSYNFIQFLQDLNVNSEAMFQELLSQIVQMQNPDDKLPCIIYDEYMYFSENVAHNLKLPSFILSASSATNLLAYHALSQLRKDGKFPFLDPISTDMVPGLHPVRFKDLLTLGLENVEALLHLLDTAHSLKSSSAMIVNTLDCLEESSLARVQEKCQVPIFGIGPMHKLVQASTNDFFEQEEIRCMEWLDKQSPKTVIYISLGSKASMDEKEVIEMAWGLANSKQPFLWVIRNLENGLESNKLIPYEFKEIVGERGLIVKWAPQKEVLAHAAVGGFWSHCGWNSTLESISEGVPMICRPCFGDQNLNARYVSEVWRVGLELENEIKREEIERVIRWLMMEDEGQKMRQRALDLKVKVKQSIEEGASKNSLNAFVELLFSC